MAETSPLATKIVGYILPFVVCGLLGFTWYIYIFRICAHVLEYNKTQAGIFMAIASLLWIMALLSYGRILFTCPGKPISARTPLLEESSQGMAGRLPRFYYSPKLFNWTTMQSRRIDAQDKPDVLPVVSISRQDGQPRYCHMCECYKPDRAHHCKDCNACVLKMDHHCPWVSGCVGFKNYKFFFLFVFYTGLYGLWVLASALPLVITAIQDMNASLDAHWIVLIVMAFIFGLTVCGFAGVHGYYIIENETTIEHLADRPYEVRVDFDTSGQNYEVVSVSYSVNLWKQSKRQNWDSVMGRNPWGWFIPIKGGLGDGIVFPYNDYKFNDVVNRAIKQRREMDVEYPLNDTHTLPTVYYEPERLSSIESTRHMT